MSVAVDAPLFTGIAAPQVRRPARSRLKVSNFPAMPYDLLEHAAADLTAIQRGARISLLAHLWFHGELPCEDKKLADIARIHPRTFARMAPVIAPHFDIDADGRWRHYDLEDLRDAALMKRAKLAKNGAKGAATRWDGGADPGTEGGNADALREKPGAETMAKGMANAMGMATEIGAEFGTQMLASVMANPSRGPGSIDRSINDNISETIDRSDARATSDAMPVAMSFANGDAGLGASHPPEKADGISHPTLDGISSAVPPARSLAEANELATIAALRAAGGDKIPALLLNTKDLAPIRALVADGCELERDVVPAVTNFARGLKEPLRTFAAGQIREKARASRDLALKKQAGATPVGAGLPQPMFTDPFLAKFAGELRGRVGAEAFASWFGGLAIAATDGGTVTMSLPTMFIRNHVDRTYAGHAAAALRASDAAFEKVAFTVAKTSPPAP